MKNIFIGGSGRSGTTIALHALYKHNEIYAVPIETKFIVEFDGLYDLVESLTTRFSVTNSSMAQQRFIFLMRNILKGIGENPYSLYYAPQEFRLDELFQTYDEALNEFLDYIIPLQYVDDRQELIGKVRKFIDSLFAAKATELSKIAWAEKTPNNISRIGFLNELYPNNYFINMRRDPRGVLYSLYRLGWCDKNLEIAAGILKQQLHFILKQLREVEEKQYKFLDVSLESLTVSTELELDRIVKFLEISPYTREQTEYFSNHIKQSSIIVDQNTGTYLDSWQREFSADQINLISEILHDEIVGFGYQLSPG